jgi:hypothetical protein
VAKRALKAILALLGVAATLTGAATSGSNSGPGTACHPGYERVFEEWGDDGEYVAVPNGAFESLSGWTLEGGARSVGGNEPFYVSSNNDSHSLSLPSGSSAVSPPLCTSLFRPKIRLFATNTGATTVGLKVEATTYVLGVRQTATIGYLSAGAGWQPTAALPFLEDLADDTIGTVSFRFTPVGVGSGWRIDDVYVDYPFKDR